MNPSMFFQRRDETNARMIKNTEITGATQLDSPDNQDLEEIVKVNYTETSELNGECGDRTERNVLTWRKNMTHEICEDKIERKMNYEICRANNCIETHL